MVVSVSRCIRKKSGICNKSMMLSSRERSNRQKQFFSFVYQRRQNSKLSLYHTHNLQQTAAAAALGREKNIQEERLCVLLAISCKPPAGPTKSYTLERVGYYTTSVQAQSSPTTPPLPDCPIFFFSPIVYICQLLLLCPYLQHYSFVFYFFKVGQEVRIRAHSPNLSTHQPLLMIWYPECWLQVVLSFFFHSSLFKHSPSKLCANLARRVHTTSLRIS